AGESDPNQLGVPRADSGHEPTGSMGKDSPRPVLSHRAPSLFRYFHQLFAQVTNPAIDLHREALVMSLATATGPDGNTLEETPDQCHRLTLPRPVLTSGQLARLSESHHEGMLLPRRLPARFGLDAGEGAVESAVERLCQHAVEAVDDGCGLLILSGRGVDARRAPIPALLALSAVHQRLTRDGIRMQTGLLVETGEAREVHDFAALFGFGAAAVNPYLALDTVRALADSGEISLDETEAQGRYVKAIEEGLLKVMSKMGISTLQSYRGAQIFEAVGLDRAVIDRHFTGTPSRLRRGGLPA